MHYIVCLNVGNVYPYSYVINLWHAVKRRVDSDYRFICYTDRPQLVPNYIETRPVPHRYHQGWWSKLALFDDMEMPDDARVTFLDLDMLIGPGFQELILNAKDDFTVINDFDAIGQPYRFGSACMTWSYGQFRSLWRNFLANETLHRSRFAGDQNFIEQWFQDAGKAYGYFDAGKVVSWKWQVQGKGYPEGWALAAFHGEPKPHSMEWNQMDVEVREHEAPSLYLQSYRQAYAGKAGELLLTGPSLKLYKQKNRARLSFGVNTILFEEGWEIDHYVIQDCGRNSHERSFVRCPEVYGAFAPNVAKWYGDFSPELVNAVNFHHAGVIETNTGPIIRRGNSYIEDAEKAAPFAKEPPFGTNGSVAFTALQMMVYMGLREVRVVGADLTGGRVGEQGNEHHLDDSNIEATWHKAAEWAKACGTEIVMVNPVGLRGKGFKEWHSSQMTNVEREKMLKPQGAKLVEVKRGSVKHSPASRMRFHLLTPPYAATSEKYLLCAYTQKVLKWMRMMEPYGYEVHHYGHPESTCPDYVQHHDVIFDDDWQKYYKGRGDWRQVFFDAHNKDVENLYNERAGAVLRQHARPKDFILHFWAGTRNAAVGLEDVQVVEPGIGYTGIFATFKVFESHSIANECYGIYHRQYPDPWPFDTIIPNYFDENDFKFNATGGNYLLYLGRIIPRKGLEIVVRLARDTGLPVIVAGQGDITKTTNVPIPDNLTCVGYADKEKRQELMSGAKAILMPTLYAEPFGGVSIEALLSGTPVISTDWGVFPETIPHGHVGYRCRTYEQFLWAVANIEKIDRRKCFDWAMANYTFKPIGERYHDYFSWLYQVAHDPQNLWYTKNYQRSAHTLGTLAPLMR